MKKLFAFLILVFMLQQSAFAINWKHLKKQPQETIEKPVVEKPAVEKSVVEKNQVKKNAQTLIKPIFWQKKEDVVTDEENLDASKQAQLFYLDNNLKKATEVLLKIPEDKRTAQDWLILGNILQDTDKTAEAVFMFNRAILLDEKFYKPYYNLGNIYLQEEKPHLAIQNYKKAIKYKNDFAYAYYNLGCAYLHLGELRKAKNAFLNAISNKQSEPNFYYNVAFIYKKMGKEKHAKTYFELYQKALESYIKN